MTISLDSWQFITLAGLHTNALISNRFAKAFAVDGMKAYTTMIQEQEIADGCEVVKHQAWSGAEYADAMLMTATGGISSTSAMGGGGSTETQFSGINLSKL